MRKLIILVVDDEPSIAEILQMTFAKAGHEAVTALNGDDALSWLKRNRADLVITDWDMPVMNGLDLIREGRKVSSAAYWIWTGRPSIEREGEAMAAGASHFFIKPTRSQILLDLMASDFAEPVAA